MADNIAITAGAGTTVATDDVSGVHYQRVKLVDGTLDSSAAIPGDATYGLDVDVTRLPSLAAGTEAIGKLAANSGVDIGDVDVLSIAAGENHLGAVGGKTILTAITFSLDTNAYAIGDVLAETQVLAACLRINDGTGILQSFTFNDKDDQGLAFDVYILNAASSMGTENAAASISDANADTILGMFSVGVGDWKDLGGCRIASIKNIGLPVKGATGTDDLYVALVAQGVPTHSASGITGIAGILCD
jgi:hypothetical protein